METESFINLEWNHEVIIAMKGLPCTQKTLVADHIGRWMKLPSLCIDDFIGAPHTNNNITDESWEESERLQVSVLDQAFTSLRRVAERQVKNDFFSCVVIKSRLSSTFELQQLFQLFYGRASWHRNTLLIVECRVRNKHRCQNSFNHDEYEKKWYRPRRWNDIEKANDDHFGPQSLSNWDLHLQLLTQQHPEILVRRLVVDPHYDLDLPRANIINPIFAHAINHLIRAEPEELNERNPYVVEFDEFRQSRAKGILNALTPSKRRDLCGLDGCLFKYKEELRVDEASCCCGVCEESVDSGQPGYTCHYCVLTLHKPCAELIHFDPHSITAEYSYFCYYMPGILPASKRHACNSHLQEFSWNCNSCIFRMAFKGRILPAVVNHYDHHPHPLSLRITRSTWFICKACGVRDLKSSYVCRICEWYYHIQCPFMPREWNHGHGGHEHILKLKYSHDDKEQEDYWCDVCFKDLDPYYWYYSCPSCRYYTAHLYCVGVYPRLVWSYDV